MEKFLSQMLISLLKSTYPILSKFAIIKKKETPWKNSARTQFKIKNSHYCDGTSDIVVMLFSSFSKKGVYIRFLGGKIR